MALNKGLKTPLIQLREVFSDVDVGKWLKLARGFLIFIIAVLAATYTTDFVLKNKIDMYFGLSGFEALPPDLPDFGTIFLSRAVQSLILLFLVVAVASLMALLRGHSWKLTSLLTLAFHSFIIIAVFTLLQVPFIMQVPRTSFAIIGASMQNVTFYNANMTGITPQGEIRICSDVVRASYVNVFRAYPNMSQPNWPLLYGETLKEALRDTVTYLNMSDVKWVSRGVEMHLDKLELSVGNWSSVSYGQLLNRVPIRTTETVTFHEKMISVLSLLSMIGLVAYNTVEFKKLYETSLKYSLVTGIVMMLAVFFLGMI